MHVEVTVWVCPIDGSYYGASSAGDLTKKPNIRSAMRNLATENPANWGSIIGYRSQCQHCRAAGREEIERIPVLLTLELTADDVVVAPMDMGADRIRYVERLDRYRAPEVSQD